MPSIDRAMAQSLHQRSVLDVVVAAVRPVVYRNSPRDIQGQISDVKTAFSSWDNCMKAAYCKWPVVALIIIAGLIVLSVVWCIARCACCGLSCCCECFYCCKCCGNCCGCCDAPSNKPHKYLDEPYGGGRQNEGYRSEERMLAQPSGYRAPPIKDTPQFASFDVSSKKPAGGDDALPEMPSWESATSTKVALGDDPVELDSLQKPTNSATVPLMADSGAGSPIRQPSPGNVGGMQTGVQNNPPYSGSMSPNASTSYLGAAGVAGSRYGQSNNQGYGRDQGYGRGQGYGSQNNGTYGDDYQDYGYGNGQQTGYTSGVTGGSKYDDYRHNGSGGGDAYGSGAAAPYGQNAVGARSASNIRAMNNRPPPQRQYASMSSTNMNAGNGTTSPHEGSGSPTNLQSNSGFDFSSGFSRPQQSQAYGGHDSYGSNNTFGYDRTTSPVAVNQAPQTSYPGYRPYNGTGSQNF